MIGSKLSNGQIDSRYNSVYIYRVFYFNFPRRIFRKLKNIQRNGSYKSCMFGGGHKKVDLTLGGVIKIRLRSH